MSLLTTFLLNLEPFNLNPWPNPDRLAAVVGASVMASDAQPTLSLVEQQISSTLVGSGVTSVVTPEEKRSMRVAQETNTVVMQ